MSTTRDPAFERAFVAMRYFLGARGSDLAEPLGAPTRAAEELVVALQDEHRARRAERLASEVGQVARALEGRCYR
jgi:hypothetical protein